MNESFIVKPAFSLIGAAVRTTNEAETGPSGKLAGLWQSYFSSGIAEKVQVQNSHLIYALYTDYESDASGAYTTLIGHEYAGGQTEERFQEPLVLEQATEPIVLEQAMVPEAKYIVFKTRKGPVYDVVAKAWGEIWAYFENASLERTYTGDFELYDTRTFHPESAEIDIYIAIK
ncbi:GyrI-like domain-containing protein [Paenibacillus sinopodophylli]|uniref:GyrI-like domain-containing protein n=1 Tax=Paenibacillus sinopodophylli TaxID=1837342 RepID=UPI00110D22BF|nr:effector binding domain-containing protein [Paenibacillus sinopodophylli]